MNVTPRPLLTPARAAFLAAVIALAVYANAPANGFAYDDVAVIQQDSVVHSLGSIPQLFARTYWRDTTLALYRPLTTATFAVDWVISDGSAAWFHGANMLWHALATALATLLIAALFGNVAALAGGVLFAVHPVHVEAVANIVGRAEVIAACFVFGAGLAWLRLRGPLRIAVVALLFALGLLAKESVIALPLLLLLLDAAAGRLRRGGIGEYARSRAGAYVALALVAVAYLLLRGAVLGGIAPTRVDPALELAQSPVTRVLTALQAWPHYLRLLLFPRTLLADYGPRIIMPVPPLTPAAWLGAVILLAALGWGVIAFGQGRGRAALLLLWVPVALLPVSNLVLPIGVIVAERLLYVPSLAPVAAAGALVALALRRRSELVRAVALVALLLVAGLGAYRTWLRTPEWQSTDHIFAAQLRDRGDNFRLHWHRARTLRVGGHPDEALIAYRTALGIWPYRPGLLTEAAWFEIERRQLGRARELARFGTRRWPADAELHRILAVTSIDLGDTLTARRAVAAGLAIDSMDDVLRRMRAALAHADSARAP